MATTVAMSRNQRQNRWYTNSSPKAHSLRTEYKEIRLSAAHFSVGGTLIEAAANLKSFRAKERPAIALMARRWRKRPAIPA